MKNPILLLALLLTLTSCGRRTIIPEEYTLTTQAYKTLPGVAEDLLSVDLYYFNDEVTTPRPVVLWVHGGAWAIGDKTNQLTHKLALCQEQGYLFVSVNYRLSPAPAELDNADRVRYPDHNNDVADALLWVQQNIAAYGGDPEKLVLMGHSAGAHLVSLSGTSPDFLPPRGLPLSALAGVVSVDTEGYDVVSQGDLELYQNAFGTDEAVQRAASPLTHVQAGTAYPPFFIAKRGGAARLAVADAFAEALTSAGASVTLVEASAYDHAGINRAIGDPEDTLVTPPLRTFLQACFE